MPHITNQIKKTIMKRLSFILGILAIAFFMTSCSSNTPKGVAEKSMKCLVDKDYKGYVDLIYTKDNPKESPEEIKQQKEMLASLLKDKAEKEYKKNKGISSYEIVNEETSENGEKAKVKMKVTYGNGEVKDEEIELCKDKDGNWKIDMGK